MSANEQFFVGAQTVVRLFQTTQIISDVCFITDHVAYASSKNLNCLNRDRTLFFFYPGWMRRVWRKVPESEARSVTLSLAFRYIPSNSARFSYATEGALFISAQLFSDASAPSERSGY